MDGSIVERVRGHLDREEYEALLALCEQNPHGRRALWLTLNEADAGVRYRGVEAVARLMERWWLEGRTEKVREYINRLLWAMNEESGQIVWSAPEAVAAIVALIPEFLDPYAGIMISRAFEGPALVASGLRGVGLLGGRAGQAIALHQELVLEVFNSRDPQILGLAAWAMGETGFAPALPYLESLLGRDETVLIDTRECLPERPLAQWAGEAIDKISRYVRS
jgi:hypothetical protein